MATAFTTTVTAIPVLLDGALTNPMEYVSFVLLELLFVLLELLSTTAAVTAVVVELCTTILNVKLFLVALVTVFTLTLVQQVRPPQLSMLSTALKQTLIIRVTHVLLLEAVTHKQLAQLALPTVLTEV
jgi:hypothetical protein